MAHREVRPGLERPCVFFLCAAESANKTTSRPLAIATFELPSRPASMEVFSSWSSLPAELWPGVFLGVACVPRAGLRLVCASWRQILDAPLGSASALWPLGHASDLDREDVNIRFTACCGSGNMEAAQWLAAAFALTAEDARAGENHALQRACTYGHLEVARWLVATFGLTAEDARATDNCALRWACAAGCLESAQWLVAAFELTAADVRACNNDALRSACANGHLGVARWLAETFALTAEDARAAGNWALRHACGYGHLEVARWLAATFALAAADARGIVYRVRGKGVERWITDRFGLG